MSGHDTAAPKQWSNPLIAWVDSRLPIFSYLEKEYGRYPMPKNANYMWSFGGIAGLMLVIMILTGLFLAMQYTPNVHDAFASKERITRDVNFGWLLQSLHANGASLFFAAVYIHILRGLYYGSYKAPRELLWGFGVLILFLMMATAFMGYVLPWGQMSFWGATVITNLFSAFPIIGESIVTWLWGGFSVGNPTLNRFFALHFLLPFVIFAVVALHVVALHVTGSNNPSGLDIKNPKTETIPFHPYMTSKDGFAICMFLAVYMVFVFFLPDSLGHPDNFIPANPLQTPAQIVPEWYLLPFYAILRAVPDKLFGVLLMIGAIAILFILPWLDTSRVRSCRWRPIYKVLFFVFVADVLLLGYIGSQPPEGWYVIAGQIATIWYFLHFLVLTPLVGWFEKPKLMPESVEDSMAIVNNATQKTGDAS